MDVQTPTRASGLRRMECGQPTRKGTPCRNAPLIWFDHWPTQELPGRCGAHLGKADKITYADRRARDEEATRQHWEASHPACWTWPEPDAIASATSAWEALWCWQDQQCAICGRRRELVVDHDHDSGLVRGLLCGPCNSRERRDGLWARYSKRPATKILGIEIRYQDNRLGESAPNLKEFRSSLAGLADEPCRRCGSAKNDPCGCPPYFRLSAWRLASSIGNAVLITARLDINDIPHAVRTYFRGEVSLEGEFIKDLIRLPRLDYIAGKWFGGVLEAKQTPIEPRASELSDPFPQPRDDAPTKSIPLALAGRLVTGLGLAGLTGLRNSDLPVQARCYGLATALGLRLANDASDGAVAVGIDELEATEHILRWVSQHLTNGGWEAESPETGPMLAETFTEDAETICEIRKRLSPS